jgi:hypothetical protein
VPTLNRLAALAWRAHQTGAPATGDPWRTRAADWARRSLQIDPNQPDIRELLTVAASDNNP